MISLFLGLSTANLLLLTMTLGLGLFATDAGGQPSSLFAVHITMGIAAGMMAVVTHIGTYTYFMATAKWLQAATDKADLNPDHFVAPALARKTRVLAAAGIAITVTMLAMFAGAASDPTMPNPWPSGIHITLALATVAINLAAAIVQFSQVRQQGLLMDEALAILNATPHGKLEHA